MLHQKWGETGSSGLPAGLKLLGMGWGVGVFATGKTLGFRTATLQLCGKADLAGIPLGAGEEVSS